MRLKEEKKSIILTQKKKHKKSNRFNLIKSCQGNEIIQNSKISSGSVVLFLLLESK
jgi:hypothetical protein